MNDTLKEPLDELDKLFDYVFIYTQPNVFKLITLALRYADVICYSV